MSDTHPALELCELTHGFGATKVLDGVSLTIDQGTIAALLGPSGSGKTTILRLIAGFERPSNGSIRINGHTVTDQDTWVAPNDRGISIVPQEGALFPHMSIGANIAYGLRRRRSDSARQRVREMLELIGLPDAHDKRPSELSGGMQQRVALARALATDPALVLLDEPFSALDAGLRENLREEVVSILRSAGATALWVTHDQDEALSTADRVAVLLDHHLVQVADPVDLYNRPASVSVARFVGDVVLLPCTVLDPSTARCVLGTIPLARPATTVASTLAVRPEQLELIPVDDSRAGARGVVDSVRYFGHDGMARVRLSDNYGVMVRVNSRHLPRIDDEVGVAVNGSALCF